MEKFKSFLKSQKTIASVILLLGIFGFAIFVSQADDQQSAFQAADKISEKNKDSDNDGLTNWEEELIGTNPYQADTDGDGFLDGEEVLSQHDPLIKSPNDNLEYIALDKEVSQKLQNPNNLTEAFIENAALLSLNSNAPTDADVLATAIRQAGGDELLTKDLQKQFLITLIYFLPPKVSDSQLNISQDNSASSFNGYLVNLHKIFAGQSNVIDNPNVSDNQAVLLAIQQNNFQYSNSLATQWNDVYKKMKSLTVPSLLKDAHLIGMNASYTLAKGYEALQEAPVDPVKAIIALQEINKGEGLVLQAYQQLALIGATL